MEFMPIRFGSGSKKRETKTFFMMRAFGLLLLFISLTASSQTPDAKISLSVTNAPLEQALKEIKKQCGYEFVYTTEQLKKSVPVTLHFESSSLDKVMDACFKEQPFTYTIDGKFIALRDRSENPKPVLNTKDISGTVFGENGTPLSDINITVASTGEATATDKNGHFSVKNIKESDVLIVSAISYITKRIPVKGKNYFEIQLSVAVNEMDETIIKGYYSTTRRLNTGSVSKIKAEDIEKQPVSNPLAAMQGRIPGIFITQQNGLPGSNFSVLIRGKNSILNGNDPLYIIDGVPFNSERLSQRDAINTNNPLNALDPGIIESIEVLKDADATAIYGSRGANGVILITTKKGKAGGTHVDINFYTGWSKVTRTLQYMNTPQYLQMRREAFQNDGVTATTANAPDLLVWDTSRYTDWKKLLIGGTAKFNNVSARISGGNATTSFLFNANYYTITTVFPGNRGENRASFNLYVSHHSTNNKFNSSFSVDNSNDQNNLNQSDLTRSVNLSPNAPRVYDSLGRLNWRENGAVFTNPFATLFKEYNNKSFWIKNNIVASYQIIDPLLFKISAGYNMQRLDETSINPIAAQDPASNPKGSAFFGIGNNINWIVEPQAEYKLNLSAKAKILALVGTSFQENKSYQSATDASGYISDATILSTVGASSTVTTRTDKTYRYEGFFGRLHLDWNHSLVINLTGRRDGSSRFGPGKQFSNFGAVGAAWIFSDTRWFQTRIPFLSFGKLRASYGVTGNDRIDDYKYLDTWSGTSYPYQGTPGIKPTNLLNKNYAWERNKKLDIAVELGLVKDRILFTAEWFRNRSDNQLISYTLPSQTGFNSILENLPGIVQNKGWEISLTSKNINNQNWNWTTSFNITIPQNKLIAFPGLSSSAYANTYVIDKSLNIIRGYQFLGVDPSSGIYQYRDINNDGIINTLDYITLGTKDPTYLGGLTNSIRYHSFQLDFLFQFVKQLGLQSIYGSGSFPGTRSNQPIQVLDHWKKSGDEVPYEKYAQQGAPLVAASKLINSDAALTNASFIRLKNVSLSHELPLRLIKKAKLRSCKIFIEGQNILTITSYKGADPESQNLLQLPPLRQLAIGIHAAF
jgi:TonB-dependent starch-binding outer membrane protein SusC